jgi:hypothetical protein
VNFACPENSSSCAHRILEPLARRAYRRAITDDDMQPLLDFFERGRAKGSPDRGFQMALRRMLASPSFLFRAETSPVNPPPGALHAIDPVALASRLSFFIW